MREAVSANTICCEINAKGNRPSHQNPWNQLAISATEIINFVQAEQRWQGSC